MTPAKSAIIRLDGKGRLTLPRNVRDAASFGEGQIVEVEVVDDNTLVLRAKHMIDRDQAWAWSPQWLAMIKQSEEDVEAGRVAQFESGEDFLASLDD